MMNLIIGSVAKSPLRTRRSRGTAYKCGTYFGEFHWSDELLLSTRNLFFVYTRVTL